MKIGILTNNNNLGNKLSKYFKVIFSTKNIKSFDVIVLISYSKIIKKELLNKKIFLNIHNSLLPKYRGLHAFTWAIINGEKILGYTLHRVSSHIDSGPIISNVKFKINKNENINSVFNKAEKVLIKWVKKELKNLNFKKIKTAKKQNEYISSYFRKRKEADNLILWTQKSNQIHNFVRALMPPYTKGAFAYYKTKKVNIIGTKIMNSSSKGFKAGKIIDVSKKGIKVKTNSNDLLLTRISVKGRAILNFQTQFKIGSYFN